MRKLSHNKKRNLGLVYEFLTREVSTAVVSKEPARAAAALSIISRHLAEGTVLHEELELHRSVMESRGVNERLAKRIVGELKSAGVRLAARSVIREKAKADLIHEMNKVLGRDVFDRYRIPDYTAHASINILMSRGLNARLDEGVEVARVEEHLIEFLKTEASVTRYDADATLFAYNKAVDIFESEIGRSLDEPQANLVREYVRVSLGGNPAPFKRTFEKQRQQLIESLRSAKLDEVFKADSEMASKLDEAIGELSRLQADTSEQSVETLMLYHNLRREISS